VSARPLLLALLLASCAGEEGKREARVREAAALAGKLSDPQAFARAVELGEVAPLVAATDVGTDERTRCLACLALGRIGGEPARAHLAALARGPEARVARFARLGLRGLSPEEARALEAREEETRTLVDKLEDAAVFARVVELGVAEPLVEATQAGKPERLRRLACLALGRIGGEEARDRLLDMLAAPTPEPRRDGVFRLYAAAGLTLLADPGTAVDLVLNLSTVNPNDNVAALAAEGQQGDYYTVDAQVCDALLAMGVWEAEKELVAQLRRRDYVRVLIDAYAILRRRTGIDLPFRYNGGYRDREADADAWARRLSETRAEREKSRPFDTKNARFRARCADMIAWLGGQSVNDRYIAEKVLVRLGALAVPFLAETLEKGGPSAQREAALVLGRIGDPSAAPALRRAAGLADGKARATAIDALRRIGDRESLPTATARLSDEDAEVRANAAALLGELGDASHRDALGAALASEKAPATTVQLARALSLLGDTTQADRLLAIFTDGEQLDRQTACDALRRLDPQWTADPLAARDERAAAAERFRRK
jgi:HEAT repeat protein